MSEICSNCRMKIVEFEGNPNHPTGWIHEFAGSELQRALDRVGNEDCIGHANPLARYPREDRNQP